MELNSYIGEIDINFVLVSLLAVFLIQLLICVWICFHDINLCRKKSKAEIDELKAEIERLSSLNDTNISHFIDLKKKMNDDYDTLMLYIAENSKSSEKHDEKFDKITFQLNTHISTSNNIFDKVVLKAQDDYTFFTQQVKSLSNLISNYHQFERDVNKKISDLESKISFGSKNSKEYISELKSMISSFNEKVEHYFDSVEQVSIKVNDANKNISDLESKISLGEVSSKKDISELKLAISSFNLKIAELGSKIDENKNFVKIYKEKFDKINSQLDTHVSTSTNIFDKIISKAEDDCVGFRNQINGLSTLISDYHSFEVKTTKKIDDLVSKTDVDFKKIKNDFTSLKSTVFSFNEKVEQYQNCAEQVSIKVKDLMPEQVLIKKRDKIIDEIRLMSEYIYSVVNSKDKINNHFGTVLQKCFDDFKYNENIFIGPKFVEICKKYFNKNDFCDSKILEIVLSISVQYSNLDNYGLTYFEPYQNGSDSNGKFDIKKHKDFIVIVDVLIKRFNYTWRRDNFSVYQRLTHGPCKFKESLSFSKNQIKFFTESDIEFEIRVLNQFFDLIKQIYCFIKTIEIWVDTKIEEN